MWRRDLAYNGLSVSLLTQPLERYDIVRQGTGVDDTGQKDLRCIDDERHDATLRPRPLPWRFPSCRRWSYGWDTPCSRQASPRGGLR